jgi:hypothetical protein
MDGKKIIIIAVGILALTGVSLGVFAFTKSRKLKKQEEDDANTGGGGSTTTGGGGSTTTGGGGSTTTEQPTQQVNVDYNQPTPPASSTPTGNNPFATKDELKAFQKWVKDNKGINIGGADGKPDGIWGGGSIKAWGDYSTEYTASLNPTQAPTTTTTPPSDVNTWSSSNYEAAIEMMNSLKQDGNYVPQKSSYFEFNLTNSSSNTALIKIYWNGSMSIEKLAYQKGLYDAKWGNWKKTVYGWEFNIGGTVFKSDFNSYNIKNTLFKVAKDLNYLKWSDGSFVPMTHEFDDFLNMTEDRNKQRRIEPQF